ncbi:MAG: hypothetical protein ACRDPL_17375 [Propionibacteriaceae bacterium]
MKQAPLPKSRLLVLIAEEICGRCLARELAERGEEPAGTFVVIIAPALVHSATATWADDIDAGIADAERKVDASVAPLRRQGYTVVGKVGDSNPVRAIEDGLVEFASDSVIVATHPADRMGLLERDLIDRLARAGTGITLVVMASDGEYPLPTPEEIPPWAYAKEPSVGRRHTRGRHRISMTHQQKERA